MNFTLDQVADVLINTPKTLHFLLAGLEDEALCWRPKKDEWSIKEVIGHLIDADKHAFHNRIQHIINDNPPQLLSKWDLHKSVSERQDNEKEVVNLLVELLEQRMTYASYVRKLTAKNMEKGSILPKVGELHVSDFVYEWAYHDMNHLQQVADNVKGYVYPFMGEVMRGAVG